jgi:hypothetical protein
MYRRDGRRRGGPRKPRSADPRRQDGTSRRATSEVLLRRDNRLPGCPEDKEEPPPASWPSAGFLSPAYGLNAVAQRCASASSITHVRPIFSARRFPRQISRSAVWRVVDMHHRNQGQERVERLTPRRVCCVEAGGELVAHPLPNARILVIERRGSIQPPRGRGPVHAGAHGMGGWELAPGWRAFVASHQDWIAAWQGRLADGYDPAGSRRVDRQADVHRAAGLHRPGGLPRDRQEPQDHGHRVSGCRRARGARPYRGPPRQRPGPLKRALAGHSFLGLAASTGFARRRVFTYRQSAARLRPAPGPKRPRQARLNHRGLRPCARSGR